MEHCRERDAISNLLNISRLGNQLMQAEKPWKLVKSGDKEDKVIINDCELLKSGKQKG
jgi:methionyl-tRNA synthetase